MGVATIAFLPDSTMWTLCPPNMRMVPTGFSFSSHLYKHYRLYIGNKTLGHQDQLDTSHQSNTFIAKVPDSRTCLFHSLLRMQTLRSRWRSCRDVKGEMTWLSQKISQVSEAGLKILYIDSSNSGNKQLKNMSTCVCVCTVMIAAGAINVSYLSPIRRRKWKRGDVHSICVMYTFITILGRSLKK